MSFLGDAIEIAKWLARIAAIFPALKELWDTAQAADEGGMDMPAQQMAAALELVRSIKAAQAKEELTS